MPEAQDLYVPRRAGRTLSLSGAGRAVDAVRPRGGRAGGSGGRGRGVRQDALLRDPGRLDPADDAEDGRGAASARRRHVPHAAAAGAGAPAASRGGERRGVGVGVVVSELLCG